MAKTKSKSKTKTSTRAKSPSEIRVKPQYRPSTRGSGWDPLKQRDSKELAKVKKPHLHFYGKGGVICNTDSIGHASPGSRNLLEIVVDASEGFIPLWEKNTTLKWRFDETSMLGFQNPEAAKSYIQSLLGEAMLLWGHGAPVKLTYSTQPWDFEISLAPASNCSPNGCVLASAFFPNSGQNKLMVYPELFEQPYDEQSETMAHELGHIFGLRHFFAKISEQEWDSEIYGEHNNFSIMNYGADSFMTLADQNDLAALYDEIWNGNRSEINGTPIQLFKPFSAFHDACNC